MNNQVDRNTKNAVRSEYEENPDTTVKQIAVDHNVSERSIYNWALQDDWQRAFDADDSTNLQITAAEHTREISATAIQTRSTTAPLLAGFIKGLTPTD